MKEFNIKKQAIKEQAKLYEEYRLRQIAREELILELPTKKKSKEEEYAEEFLELSEELKGDEEDEHNNNVPEVQHQD